ncbi:TMV resistance protein N-like [Punica granatum]|uniref:TMV resistance protein N-like n=1 Tax=Punica granatum TaxID=22663 RepID=A0A6P8E819_PUNGR|nr:TMV resistance protein N-like [Punica granatum]
MGFEDGDGSGLWRWALPLCLTFLSLFASVLVFSVFLIKNRARSIRTASIDAVRDLSIDSGQTSSLPIVGDQPGYEYEVFLSFRGPDTRKGFTDYLYNALIDAGVRSFRDDNDLRKGEEIGPELLAAIKQSKVSVPIFSKDYASSKWCLKELAQMVECRNTIGQLILPIFYDVVPNEVRHQTGNYGKAFSQHARRYNAETVQLWRDALAEVGKLKGWDLENTANGHQGQLTKLVVAEVLKELKKRHLLVTDSLVGTDDQTEVVMQLLEIGKKDVRIVGLWGMGGIGKTTIAKAIYNQILDQFEGCSFLKDIRETSSRHRGLEYLQSQLVADITRRKQQDFASLDDGINELKRRFRDKKVLILLDDIDHRNQLNALAKELHWFGPGSRILVTSRNKDVLQVAQVDEKWIYEVKEMDREQALQLFCKHAFRNSSPLAELTALAKDIAGTTGGLPLALEVIGSFLSTKSKVVWESTLDKLRAMPDGEVQDKLRISYNALDYEEKQIFLDIACIFVGEDIQIVKHMWKDCNFFPDVGIEVLLLMSLVKIGDDNKLWMHDQLRDLGREVVRRESYIEPGKRSRLWQSEEARVVLEKERGSTEVEAIRLDFKIVPDDYSFTDRQFRNLINLRFLRLECADLVGNFHNLLERLRWLRWHNSSFKITPTDLNLDNLVILDLSQTEVGDDWTGWSSVKMAVKLKVLHLNHCNFVTRTPDFSVMTNLERLSMNHCHRLELIDPSIGKLKSLIYLDMSFCWNIEKLPDQIGSLKSLEKLILDGTQIRDVPISRHMKKLEVLQAKDCIYLNRIPDSIGHTTCLSDLLLDSSNIIELPESIGLLGELRHLSLKGCSLLREIPDSIGQLKSLTKLNISSTSVTRLPDSVGTLENLEVLDIHLCGIRRFPRALGNLRKLSVINASFCTEMEGEPPSELGQISLLKVLILDHTEITTLPESIGSLSHLETLDLKGCSSLHTLPALPAGLSTLRVSCKSRNPIPNLPALTNLKEMMFWSCDGLRKLPVEISGLSKLEKLEFHRTSIRTLPDEIGALSGLKSLNIAGCWLLSLPTLPPSLYELSVVECNSFRILPDLSNLGNLSELCLRKCPELKEIRGLGNLVFLARLEVSGCPRVTKLDGIEGLEGLRILEVSSCENLEKLPDLSKMKKLSELKANDCKKLSEIEGLDDLCSLRYLEIRYCTSLEILPDLSCLKLLESLVAEGCEMLKELEGLDELEALEELDIRNCKEIKRLPNLSKLKSLNWLKMLGCENLKEIPGLEEINPISVSRY